MDFVTGATTIALIHLMAVVSPGPDFAMVMRNSLSYSRRAGIFTTMGLVIGASIHFTYCLLGIGLIISQSVVVFNIIKLIGAAYLIYVGVQALKAKPAKAETVHKHLIKKMGDLKAVRSGFMTNLLNPKAALYFLSVFTLVITPETPLWQKISYGGIMAVVMLVWFTLVAVLFSNKKLKSKLVRIQHWIERAFGVVLIGLGLKIALTKM